MILHQSLRLTEVDFDGEPVANLEEARNTFNQILTTWFKGSKAQDLILCLSDDRNFRKALVPSYKAARGPKPPGFVELKAWVGEEFKDDVLRFPTLEADDAIGIKLTELGDKAVAVSVDKDMATIPGLHFNPAKETWAQISEDEANLNWMRQVLTGDAIDGYTGVPKIGPARAAKILHRPAPLPVLWRVVLDTYEGAKLDHKFAVATARLAYILRNGDYDQSTGEVIWKEPKPCGREDLPPEYSRNVSSGGSSSSTRHRRSNDRPRTGRRKARVDDVSGGPIRKARSKDVGLREQS